MWRKSSWRRARSSADSTFTMPSLKWVKSTPVVVVDHSFNSVNWIVAVVVVDVLLLLLLGSSSSYSSPSKRLSSSQAVLGESTLKPVSPECDSKRLSQIVKISEDYIDQLSNTTSFTKSLQLTLQLNSLLFSTPWQGTSTPLRLQNQTFGNDNRHIWSLQHLRLWFTRFWSRYPKGMCHSTLFKKFTCCDGESSTC